MAGFTQRYLAIRLISTIIAISIVIANLWLWNIEPGEIETISPSYIYRALIYGMQSFLFSYLGFILAENVSRFYWNRWKVKKQKSIDITSQYIKINSDNGTKIQGYLQCPTRGDETDLIIISHGINDTQENSNHFARAFVLAGFNVFTWAYRGSEGRKGKITDFNGHILDLKSIIEYWDKKLGNRKRSNILLCGWSLGGMVSLISGFTDHRIQKIYAWSTWSNLKKNILWKIYINPFAFFRYLIRKQLMFITEEQNKAVSPVLLFKKVKQEIKGHEFRKLVRDRVFLSHARDDKLVSYKNFVENVETLELPSDQTHLFNKGSHLMIRNEPVLLGHALSFFRKEGDED
jgi:esterase/lipase